MIFSEIPQANRSTDSENDLIANMIGLIVIAVHSCAVHLNLHTSVGILADVRNHRIVPVHSQNVLRLKHLSYRKQSSFVIESSPDVLPQEGEERSGDVVHPISALGQRSVGMVTRTYHGPIKTHVNGGFKFQEHAFNYNCNLCVLNSATGPVDGFHLVTYQLAQWHPMKGCLVDEDNLLLSNGQTWLEIRHHHAHSKTPLRDL